MSVSMTHRVLLLVVCATSFRMKKKSSRQIDLYTYGAAKVNYKRWPRSGCFDGQRAENEDLKSGKLQKDIVTWLMMGYRHPEMQTVRLFQDRSSSEVKPCGWLRNQDSVAKEAEPIIALHDMDMYVERAMAFGGRLGVVADVGLRYSYNITPPLAEVKGKGYGLVASAVVKGEEVSHLFQHPTSLECILTFEGTDRASEWFNNIDLSWKTFCGFGYTHEGFRDVLLSMCTSSEFQTSIRPNLGFCSKISVTGHSLGGAMATLWTGCVLSGNVGRTDYDNLKFEWRTPKKLATK